MKKNDEAVKLMNTMWMKYFSALFCKLGSKKPYYLPINLLRDNSEAFYENSFEINGHLTF